MNQDHRHPYQFGMGLAILLTPLPLTLLNGRGSIPNVLPPTWALPAQITGEVIALVLALLIFITGYRAILSARKGAVVWLGIAFLGVGLLDLLYLLHTLDLAARSAQPSALLASPDWIAARVLAAIALLTYALLPSVPAPDMPHKQITVAATVALVLTWSLANRATPASVTLQVGRYVLEILLLLGLSTLVVLWLRRHRLASECLMALALAASLSSSSTVLFLAAGDGQAEALTALGLMHLLASYAYLAHATVNEALHRPLAQLQTQHQRETVTLAAAPDAILWVDSRGIIQMANPAVEKMTGYAPAELVGHNISIFLPERLRAQHAESIRRFFLTPAARAMGMPGLKLLCRDGRMLPVDIALGHWQADGEPQAIAYVRDLTERHQFEESLRHHATHDELTDLPNRWLFQLQLNQALGRSAHTGLRAAVLFLDLDHFKSVNDSYGHSAGDALLIQVGQRIRTSLRANDTLARMGGDEFAILLTDLVNAEEAVGVATKLLGSLQAPYHLPKHDVYTGGSVGLAFYPDDASDSDTLLRYADMAMYQAKQAGRGSYACYSREMDQRVRADMQLYTRLKEAITQDALSLHYQPQVSIADGTVIGVEALLRWRDPVLGPVSPSQFIPVAEATGQILPLSDWVLDTACQQIAAWCQAGTPLRIAVNISAHQLRQGLLHEKVKTTLLRHGAEARWLELEVTETVAMTQPREALTQLQALVTLGCSVSLDDFGTGYSSLAHLKTLPVRKIKIDQSFVRDIPHDPSDAVIVHTLIGMARTLGLDVIAEGVETDEQRALLDGYGCPAYQGYLFCRPLPAKELEAFLRSANPDHSTAGYDA